MRPAGALGTNQCDHREWCLAARQASQGISEHGALALTPDEDAPENIAPGIGRKQIFGAPDRIRDLRGWAEALQLTQHLAGRRGSIVR